MPICKAEDAAVPRGDTEDTEVYRKHGDEADSVCQLMDQEKVVILILVHLFQGFPNYLNSRMDLYIVYSIFMISPLI